MEKNIPDINSLKKFLNLDFEAISWQGRYLEDFESFFQGLISQGDSFAQVYSKLNILINFLKVGPLKSWLKWLRQRVIIYDFFTTERTIELLVDETGLSIKDIILLIRNHLVDIFPFQESQINPVFNVHANDRTIYDFTSQSLNSLFKGFYDPAQVLVPDRDLMQSLEVTLYDDWKELYKKFAEGDFNFASLTDNSKSRFQISKSLKYVLEALIVTSIALLVGFGVKYLNKYYEKLLVERIQIFEPSYFKPDATVSFKVRDLNQEAANLDLSPELEIEQEQNILPEFTLQEEERIGTESDVVLTSWDSLPKDFGNVSQETSMYEESQKGGFRDTRFGDRKAYRVMMKSINTLKSRNEINELITKYQVEKGDNVNPGTYVPGGVYYNLFVPREFLKEFLAQIMTTEESILYESRTRSTNPPGKNKVFIWVKSI